MSQVSPADPASPTSPTGPIRVVLVDDQELIRVGFRMILAVEDDIEVVGEATDGDGAVRLAAELAPDVVLMDVRMPGTDGIAATERITRDQPEVRVLILTTFDDDAYLFSSLRAGASGFLLKNCPPDDLVQAIRLASQGHALLAPEVTQRVIERSTSRAEPQPNPLLDTLTDRERDVLVAMARGMSNAEIADALFVSAATVKSHVSRIFTKIGVRDRVQAVIAAYDAGLMSQGPLPPA